MEVRALDHVSVDIPPRQFTAVMGPSGCGKSTLVHCLAGLDTLTVRRDRGRRHRSPACRRRSCTILRRDRIGFVFQSFNLIPTLTALENITLPGRPRAIAARPGVARHGDRHGRPPRPPRPPPRPSSPAVSSSESPSLDPWPGDPRSCSPTSRPATSTAAPRERSSVPPAQRSTSSARPIVMVTHDPNAAALQRPRRVPGRRPGRRRDGRPTTERVLERMKRSEPDVLRLSLRNVARPQGPLPPHHPRRGDGGRLRRRLVRRHRLAPGVDRPALQGHHRRCRRVGAGRDEPRQRAGTGPSRGRVPGRPGRPSSEGRRRRRR